MSVPVLAIVGHADSGKTTLLEKLITYLSEVGIRIATIKHTHHRVTMDQPGTDSWRHKQAGASASFLVGADRLMMVADVGDTTEPRQIIEAYCEGYDLVLMEGYSSVAGAKIEVVRDHSHPDLRCCPSELLAVVTDLPETYPGLAQFGSDAIESLGDAILTWMHTGKVPVQEDSTVGQAQVDIRESH